MSIVILTNSEEGKAKLVAGIAKARNSDKLHGVTVNVYYVHAMQTVAAANEIERHADRIILHGASEHKLPVNLKTAINWRATAKPEARPTGWWMTVECAVEEATLKSKDVAAEWEANAKSVDLNIGAGQLLVDGFITTNKLTAIKAPKPVQHITYCVPVGDEAAEDAVDYKLSDLKSELIELHAIVNDGMFPDTGSITLTWKRDDLQGGRKAYRLEGVTQLVTS